MPASLTVPASICLHPTFYPVTFCERIGIFLEKSWRKFPASVHTSYRCLFLWTSILVVCLVERAAERAILAAGDSAFNI